VPLSRDRRGKIEAYVQTLPEAERRRLAAQTRGEFDCRFLDKADHRCAIYPVRPWICEIFGRVEKMPCPLAPDLVNILPSFLEETGLIEEYKSEAAGNSSSFNWLKK
jgi:Fe-S-cluster containining protein